MAAGATDAARRGARGFAETDLSAAGDGGSVLRTQRTFTNKTYPMNKNTIANLLQSAGAIAMQAGRMVEEIVEGRNVCVRVPRWGVEVELSGEVVGRGAAMLRGVEGPTRCEHCGRAAVVAFAMNGAAENLCRGCLDDGVDVLLAAAEFRGVRG